MKRFFKSDSFKILAVILIVSFFGVLCASFSHSAASPFTTVMSTVFSPLHKISTEITNQLNGVSSSFVSSSVYKKENDKLKKEIAEYREKLAGYDELKTRVEAYEELYEVKKENPDYKFSYGKVISKDAADAYNTFVLDVGSKDGVEVDDPVISGNYVAGVVKKVNLTTCVVGTVLDPRVNVGAYESGTREYGYVSGDDSIFKDGLCCLSGLENGTSVVSGGVVCTSGSGGIFPDGLIIGEIVSVKNDSDDGMFYAEVKPFADFSQLSDVFVITSFDGQEKE